MRVVIDKYVPYLAEVLATYAEVLALDPADITAEVTREADALIIRTRTQCNEALLAGSKVQFIATATIGFDHIDADYCASQGIKWMSCPGCNAQGVADYVETVAPLLSPLRGKTTIGIVGCGHVGSKVVQMAERRGWRVLVSDPPREERGEIVGVSLDRIAREADIITFHTPLTKEGIHATYHLANKDFFAQCKQNVLIINAARGGVVDEAALLAFLQTNGDAQAVIDCWEGEPKVNKQLLERAAIATYHIAGYTLEGKYNASQMCLEGLIQHFDLDAHTAEALRHRLATLRVNSTQPQVGFDIHATSVELKAAPDQFEQLRKNYILR